MIAVIDYDKNCLCLKMSYNEACIEDLKDRIPADMRQWDAEAKIWYISLLFLDTLIEILLPYCKTDSHLMVTSRTPVSPMYRWLWRLDVKDMIMRCAERKKGS